MSRPAKYCDIGGNWFTGCEPGLPCWALRGYIKRLKAGQQGPK